jgi:hypothetical protein
MSHWQMDLSIKLMKQEFGRQLQLDPETSKEIKLYFFFEGEELRICPEFKDHVFKRQSLPLCEFKFARRQRVITQNIFTKGLAREIIEYLEPYLKSSTEEAESKLVAASLIRKFCEANLIAISLKSSF